VKRRRALVAATIAALLTNCGQLQPSLVVPADRYAQPYAKEHGTWQSIADDGALQAIVRLKNGDFWITGEDVETLSRVTPKGHVTTYPIGYYAVEMTADRNGDLWFTNARSLQVIVRATLGATLHLTPFSLSDEAYGGIILGGDGNIWFTEGSHVGRLTPAGALKEYPTPQTMGASGLAWAPSGLVWFSTYNASYHSYVLTSLDPATASVEQYDVPTTSSAVAMLATSDGALWFELTGQRDTLVRYDPATQQEAKFMAPRDFGGSPCPGSIAVAPDGSIWFATQRLRGIRFDKRVVGGGFVRFDVKAHRFTAYASPHGYHWNCDLIVAPNGKVWGTSDEAVTTLSGG
jgi:streptogramin lyase